MAAEPIKIRGRVQGVGFRPMVWRVARATEVLGNVINDGGIALGQALVAAARILRPAPD